MEKICEEEICTGCFSCFNVCPMVAITMREDDFGFMHPVINHHKCIDCGLCTKVCPMLNKPYGREALITYAAISKNEDIYQNSTSGGVATTLSQYVISKGGIVYGAAFDKSFNLVHSCIDNVNKLSALQGSKYVQSNIGYAFKHIKNDLLQRKVMFIGTPCQVAGLLNYIPNKLQENLITISFICGGVPSIKFLKQNLGNLLDEAESLKFRNGVEYGFWIKNTVDTIYIERYYNNYFRAFDNKISLRLACYNCQFACIKRVGDITIGDFWGIKEGRILNYMKDGISIVICSTNKGEKIMEATQSNFYLEKHNLNETLSMNPRLITPPNFSNRVRDFRKIYLKTKDFDKSVNSILWAKYEIYDIKKALKKIFFLQWLYSKIKQFKS